MAGFVETFTNGLTKQNYQYVNDAVVQYTIESRLGFQNINGMPNSTGTPNAPVGFQARYLHLQSTAPVNGKLLKRHIPCQVSAITTYMHALQTGGAASVVNLDGVQFRIMGYTGEYFHKSRG